MGWWHWWMVGDIWVFQQLGREGAEKGETQKALDLSRAVTARGWSSRYCFEQYLLHTGHCKLYNTVHYTVHTMHSEFCTMHIALYCSLHFAHFCSLVIVLLLLCTFHIAQCVRFCTMCNTLHISHWRSHFKLAPFIALLLCNLTPLFHSFFVNCTCSSNTIVPTLYIFHL